MATPLALSASRRLTLTERLSRMEFTDTPDGQEIIFNLMQEFEEATATEKLAYGFRHEAGKTQRRQDFHLGIYRSFIRFGAGDPSLSDHDVDRLAFPADHNEFLKKVRIFIIFVFSTTVPRARGVRHIEYGSLGQYRSSIVFWSRRKYDEFNLAAPNTSKVFNSMTEAMRFVKMRDSPGPQRKARMPAIGLPELRQLIDYDVIASANPDNAEQHHLAWCIARQTAVRAASLASDAFRQGPGTFLAWDQIQITRAEEPGQFRCEIRLESLKTQRADPEAGNHRQITCYLDSPDQENIIFSVPHRLLVIALRRNLIQGIDTVDDLLQSTLQHITIKPEHLKDPVLWSSKARGLDLRPNEPMLTANLRHYLHLRGQKLGYKTGISFHALRRQAATDLALILGMEATRELMNHAPDSRTLERYYVNARPSMQTTAATLGQALLPEGQDKGKAALQAPLAATALEQSRIARLRGHAMNTLAQSLIDQAVDFPGDSNGQKNYIRRAREAAYHAIRDEEHAEQKRLMTVAQAKERLELLEISHFARRVKERAEGYQRGKDPSLAAKSSDLDFAEAFEEITHDDVEYEPDADDREPDESGDIFVRDTNIELRTSHATEANDPATYLETAHAFMDILMNHDFNAHIAWHERDDKSKQCALCLDDNTVPDDTRFKIYTQKSHHDSHVASSYHGRFASWLRRMRLEHEGQVDDDRWYCPYHHDETYSRSNLKGLTDHVRESTVSNTSALHEKQKGDDGWFDKSFGGVSERSERTWVQNQMRVLRNLGIRVPVAGLRTPVPHPDYPGASYGLRNGPDHAAVVHGLKRGNEFTEEEREAKARRLEASVAPLMTAGATSYKGVGGSQDTNQANVPDHLMNIIGRGIDVKPAKK